MFMRERIIDKKMGSSTERAQTLGDRMKFSSKAWLRVSNI